MSIENILLMPIVLIAALVGLYLLWVIIPAISGLPWIPTRPSRIRRALELAELIPGEIFYDLGSGDGRALILAAREFGARAVGVEISPIHCIAAKILALYYGVNKQVKIRWASFYRANFSDADVIFLYMTSKEASRLRTRLKKELRSGARVITISCEVDGWLPVKFNQEELIFIYRIDSTQVN
jgi:SAM-dependent methyltransferase